MGDKTIIVCANCGKKVRIDQFTYPDYSCPKCGEQLPYEGNHNGEYVIFCPDDICHAANTPEE
ncbi:MAG: hypothetical protein IJS08_09155, partial [Victivallales bacterium]|nr:hypothetical protein [Victivallales bacterium]